MVFMWWHLFLLREDVIDKFEPKPLTTTNSENKKEFFTISLESFIKPGAELELNIHYTGKLFNETTEGLFRVSYVDPNTKSNKWMVAAYLRPNLARAVFPCYDEPAYKVPMAISIARHRDLMAVSNMPKKRTKKQ